MDPLFHAGRLALPTCAIGTHAGITGACGTHCPASVTPRRPDARRRRCWTEAAGQSWTGREQRLQAERRLPPASSTASPTSVRSVRRVRAAWRARVVADATILTPERTGRRTGRAGADTLMAGFETRLVLVRDCLRDGRREHRRFAASWPEPRAERGPWRRKPTVVGRAGAGPDRGNWGFTVRLAHGCLGTGKDRLHRVLVARGGRPCTASAFLPASCKCNGRPLLDTLLGRFKF